MRNKIVRVSVIIFVCIMAFIWVTKDLIVQQFPTFGSMLQASFGIKPKNQEATLIAQQTTTLKNADIAIATAEKMLAVNENQGEEIIVDESTVWQVSTEDKMPQPTISLNENIKKFAVVHINPHPKKLPSEGEQVVMPMFNGQTIKANVEATKTSDAGDYTWSGHLDGYNNDYPIVMTYGEKQTFATITTPEGSYSMESVNGVGWLYKNPSVSELSKPGGNDSVEIQLP